MSLMLHKQSGAAPLAGLTPLPAIKRMGLLHAVDATACMREQFRRSVNLQLSWWFVGKFLRSNSLSTRKCTRGERADSPHAYPVHTIPGPDIPNPRPITNPIPSGKSAVVVMLRSRGTPCIDADAIVHQLYSKGGAAVAPVAVAFPSAVVDGAVSRPQLSKCVVGNEAAMKVGGGRGLGVFDDIMQACIIDCH